MGCDGESSDTANEMPKGGFGVNHINIIAERKRAVSSCFGTEDLDLSQTITG